MQMLSVLLMKLSFEIGAGGVVAIISIAVEFLLLDEVHSIGFF